MDLSAVPVIDMDRQPTLAQILEKPVRVTQASLFIDDTWYLDGWTPGYHSSKFAIRWTVDADERLINGLKYLTALLFLERDGGKVYAHSTAGTFSAGARHLLRFMTLHAYTDFSQLDADAIDLFTRSLHVALSDPEQAEDDDLEEGGDDEQDDCLSHEDPKILGRVTKRRAQPARKQLSPDEFTYAAAFNRLRMLKLLWDHRIALEGAGIPVMDSNPFPNGSVVDAAKAASAIIWDLIPPLPDEVANAIMSNALRLIYEPADDVIELQRRVIDHKLSISRETPPPERRRIAKEIERFGFTEVDGKPWRNKIVLDKDGIGGPQTINALVDLIRDACLITIFSGTGCRISEVLSLQCAGAPQELPLFATRQSEVDLPACISTEPSKTRLHELFYMRAKLSKGQERPTDERWLIGSRPMDRKDVEPLVVRAIRVLERLYEPWRSLIVDENERRRLVLNFKSHGLPRTGSGIGAADAWITTLSLRQFYARPEVGLAELQPLVKQNRELAPYVRKEGRCIRPHQWRKTFALYMMRLDERMLPAISRHFKHLSLAVTEGAYMPRDPSMIAAADSVQMRETHRALYEMRRGDGAKFAKLDRMMDGFTSDLQKLIGDLPLDESYEKVSHALITRDIRIFHSDHGRCLIAANPDRARCHDAGGTTSWRRLRPNEATRTPSLCAGCENFSISAEHSGFWMRRYLENRSAWLLADGSADFEIVRRRAEQARAILQALGATPPEVTRLVAADYLASKPTAQIQPSNAYN